MQDLKSYIPKRGIVQDITQIADDSCVFVANSLKIECPMCAAYHGWCFEQKAQ